MATQNKITEMLAATKAIYPYYAKDTDVTILVGTWKALLKDYPDNVVEIAFFKCLQTCKMPPTPADVLENIKALQEAAEPTDEELWDEFVTALRETERLVYYFRFNAIQPNGRTQGDNARSEVNGLWEALPERLKQYIGGKGEFIRMAQNYDPEDFSKYIKPQFLKTMPTIKARQEFRELNLMLQGGGDFLKLERGND